MLPLAGSTVFVPGRFRLLLVSLLLFMVGTATSTSVGHGPLVEFILLATTIVVAVLELHVRGQRRLFSVAFASAVILLSLVDNTVRLRHVPMIASAVVGLFAGFVVWFAYASVMRPHRPVGDRIVGAICVYVLIGLAFSSVYQTLDDVAPGSFRFPADTSWATPSQWRYRYFSFITLATLGYGDVTPVTVLAGAIASIEAIVGQLYIGITVARLVALSLAERARPDDAPKSGV
jgi:voltage-gated potassium channel